MDHISSNPVIDLSFLPIEEQGIEYFDRLKSGKANPDKAVKVSFYMNGLAKRVVDSCLDRENYSFEGFFLAS